MLGSKTILELFGTAILAFTIQASAGADLAPLAVGGILASLVVVGGPLSGGHYNPAVSFAAALGGSLKFPDLLAYAVAQVLGGILGGLVGRGVGSNAFALDAGEDAAALPEGLFDEAVFAFVLCFAALGVAGPEDDRGGNGLAVGLAVMTGAIAFDTLSAFNPAVALGLSISAGLSHFLYAVFVALAHLIGGAVAAGGIHLIASAKGETGKVGENTSLYQSVN